MKNLAVIFPGIGYNICGTLLHFSKEMLLEKNYEVIDIKYDKLPKDLNECYKIAYKNSKDKLSNIDFNSYNKVIFVSKSIGTIIAGKLNSEINKKINNIYFTPVEQSLNVINDYGIVFSGTKDPWINESDLKEFINKKKYPLYLYEGANHSIETEDVIKNIDYLKDIFIKCEKYIDSL